MDNLPTDETVFQSLDNAIENGYELMDWTPAEIARDIHEYDSQFESVEVILLIPIVERWKAKKFMEREKGN